MGERGEDEERGEWAGEWLYLRDGALLTESLKGGGGSGLGCGRQI